MVPGAAGSAAAAGGGGGAASSSNLTSNAIQLPISSKANISQF